MKKCIEILISLGYTNDDAKQIVNSYPLCNLKKEKLIDNIIKNYELLSHFYSNKEIIKMTKLSPVLYGYGEENIKGKIRFLESLGYSKEQILKMIKNFPKFYVLSEENIKDKLEFIVSLGYTKEEILKMTSQSPHIYSYSKIHIMNKVTLLENLGYTKEQVINITKKIPTLFGLSEENIKEKIEYLNKIGLGFIVTNNSMLLIQGVKLTYARYEYLTKERCITITKDNYDMLFTSVKRFQERFGVTKQELLEKYDYELENKLIKKD